MKNFIGPIYTIKNKQTFVPSNYHNKDVALLWYVELYIFWYTTVLFESECVSVFAPSIAPRCVLWWYQKFAWLG